MRKYRVYKYATGENLPPDAEFLSTVVEEIPTEWGVQRLVWHYFRVVINKDGAE